MDVRESYAPWCAAEEVMVQLRPGYGFILSRLGRDDRIEIVRLEKEDGSPGPLVPPVPFLAGKLRVVGELLELAFRFDEQTTAFIALPHDIVQNVTRVERSLIQRM